MSNESHSYERKHSSAMFWKVLFDLVRESTVPVCVYISSRKRDREREYEEEGEMGLSFGQQT